MKFRNILLILVSVLFLDGCTGVESGKQFYIYDALDAYQGKPADMSADKFSRLSLLYEPWILTDEKEPDWDKVAYRIELAKQQNIRTISTDIEHWYSMKDPQAIKDGLTEIFDKFKEEIPGCLVGNYGVPVTDLNVLRYSSTLKGKTEEEIQARWISDSRRRMPAAEACDVVFPSMYTMTDDIDQYEKDVKITADYIRENVPGKKIIAYLWPQFYNLHSEPVDFYQRFMNGEQWSRVLEVCYDNFDGVVLWCHGRDENNIQVSWEDPRVQEIYEATKKFMAAHKESIVVK